MAPRFLFARRFDDGAAQVAAGARRWTGPATGGAAVPFSFPRLEPASASPPLPAPEAPAPTFSAAELASAVEAARREAYAEAASELQAELTASREQREADALAALSQALAASRDALERMVATRASASRDLALALARALVARALAAQPLADVEAMFRELVVRLEGQPCPRSRQPVRRRWPGSPRRSAFRATSGCLRMAGSARVTRGSPGTRVWPSATLPGSRRRRWRWSMPGCRPPAER
ncbi:MAG: hypothetical protein K0R41_1443 [Geminicoccaceae bacterium]|nr:hypothetical protein [Geminicoccaceae bacterium]